MPLERGGVRRTCRLFWCYQCGCAVRIVVSSAASSDVSCPICHGRFLRELDLPRPRLLFDFVPHPNSGQRRNAEDDDNRRLLASPWIVFSRPSDEGSPAELLLRGRRIRRLRRSLTPPPSAPSMEGRNPGDYFTGLNWRQLIEEITQDDQPGLPPAPAAAIQAMPTVSMTADHLKDSSQCPVCKEEFELGEKAREMPCKHVYHSDCIVPWLVIHNSCPVCRLQLPAGPNASSGDQSTPSMIRNGNLISRRPPERWNPFTPLSPNDGSIDQGMAAAEEDDLYGDPGGGRSIVLPGFLVVSLCFLLLSFFV